MTLSAYDGEPSAQWPSLSDNSYVNKSVLAVLVPDTLNFTVAVPCAFGAVLIITVPSAFLDSTLAKVKYA